MSKRIIAFAALVVTGQEATAKERSEHQSEENAFLSRARKATSEVFQFDTGWALISQIVEYSKLGSIDDIRIHDHGFGAALSAKIVTKVGMTINIERQGEIKICCITKPPHQTLHIVFRSIKSTSPISVQ